MSKEVEIIFLGVNDAGMRIYQWLCEQEDVFVHSLLTTKEQLQIVETIQPHYIISCGYSHIVPQEVLEIPSEGCLNLHPSYLPYNRGANPNVWSIVEDAPAGVTLHRMDESIDTGEILAQKRVEKRFSDTGKSLHQRLEDAQVELFKTAWPAVVANEISGESQDKNTGTYAQTEDFENLCKLNPDETVRVKSFLDRLRALTFPPYDNARIDVDGETYYITIDITKA